MDLIRKFVLGVLLATPTLSFASDWQPIVYNRSTMYYLDYESVTSHRGLVKAWISVKYSTPQKSDASLPQPYIAEKNLQYFDCKKNLMGMTAFTLYAANGTVVDSFAGDVNLMKLTDVVPDSIGERIFKVACSPSERVKIKAMNESFRKKADDAGR